ncbi:MAG: hypothetical protein JJT94_13045 [Bernardetiaceae bacterium]|nr:hypothetical protein [Bernardetiaceae bacterium]
MHTFFSAKHYFFFFLLLVFSEVKSQTPSETVWHHGEIYLFTEQHLKGKIKYSLDNNLLQYLDPSTNTMKTYTASQVEWFEFFDKGRETVRVFYALPYSDKSDYERLIFLELLWQGDKLSLLTREQMIEYRQDMMGGMWGMGMHPNYYFRQEIKQNFFILNDKGKVIAHQDDDQNILNQMQDERDKVLGFIQNHRLRLNRISHLKRLLMFYNAL